jgi:hypothetical protein
MKKLTSGLMPIVLALSAGCAAQQPRTYVQPQAPQSVQVTDDYLTLADANRIKIEADKNYTVEELSAVIDQYQTLKASKETLKTSKADNSVKEHYNKTVGAYEQIITDAFNKSDIFAYVGYAGDKAVEYRPSNIGGVMPLFVGKGKDVPGLTIEQKIDLLSKSRRKWAPYAVKGNSIDTADVYSTAVRVDAKQFKKVLESRPAFGFKDTPGHEYLDSAKWAKLTDGNYDNGEVRNGNLFLTAAYNGHAKEDKK